jgi:hypothetical protein
MKWLSGGLTFFNATTIFALALGLIAQGLSRPVAILAVLAGLAAAFLAYLGTKVSPAVVPKPKVEVENDNTRKRRRERRRKESLVVVPPRQRYRTVWLWVMGACFAIFAVRSFCWLVYIDGNEVKIQSPNNLGDLSLHLTYINQFASGVPLWPDNPIHVFSKLRYPAGTDLFNGTLTCLGIDVMRGLAWTGLLASLATCYAFYRWAGNFGIAAFLFNGGVASYPFLSTFVFQDYQGGPNIAWKSLPLAMFVTQRGMLYALPAALLLLYQWRALFFPNYQGPALSQPANEVDAETPAPAAPRTAPLPFWVELSLYATMPLYHVHTFMALTVVLVFLFLFGNAGAGKRLLLLVAAAFVPATFCVWIISDHFRAGSVVEWKPGWVQSSGDMAMPFLQFWLWNFGAWVPLILFFMGITVLVFWKTYSAPDFKMPAGLAFLVPAVPLLLLAYLIKIRIWQSGNTLLVLGGWGLILFLPVVIAITAWLAWRHYHNVSTSLPPGLVFLLSAAALFSIGYLVKLAPWEWDNIKIIVWAYFIILPFLWTDLMAHWPLPMRGVVCVALFASGFVTLFGGLVAGKGGYGLIDRSELDGVGIAVRKLPADARYAGFPTFNHPILLQGRKMVLGYPGHLWTQGFDYSEPADKLKALMEGAPNWKELARFLHARYLFWGKEEKANYVTSRRPWEREATLVASGEWGALYDLEAPPPPMQASPVPGH